MNRGVFRYARSGYPYEGPISVDIDELVVQGFDRASAGALANEIVTALTRALTEHGPPRQWIEGATGGPGRQGGASLYLPQLEVTTGAGASPAAIAATLAARLCAGPARGDGDPA